MSTYSTRCPESAAAGRSVIVRGDDPESMAFPDRGRRTNKKDAASARRLAIPQNRRFVFTSENPVLESEINKNLTQRVEISKIS